MLQEITKLYSIVWTNGKYLTNSKILCLKWHYVCDLYTYLERQDLLEFLGKSGNFKHGLFSYWHWGPEKFSAHWHWFGETHIPLFKHSGKQIAVILDWNNFLEKLRLTGKPTLTRRYRVPTRFVTDLPFTINAHDHDLSFSIWKLIARDAIRPTTPKWRATHPRVHWGWRHAWTT